MSEEEGEATALQRKILRNGQEQYWQQPSRFTECSKLLLSEDKRHNIINPAAQRQPEPGYQPRSLLWSSGSAVTAGLTAAFFKQ